MTLALCASYQGDALEGLQYRFARNGTTELEFPKARFSLREFKANHYVRFQTDYSLIKFSSGAYTYGIYSNYDGEAGQADARSAGVAVSNASDVEVANKRCARIEVDELQEVIPQLACDPDDALGCS
ncbi:hypothetical protein [Pseudomonas cremoricolorata]|uniref:hypothetical protein n=1 Tax=Pseudomonas cremoricolorata TaxID=157783 RepID=UPI0012B5229A|nr:hypothetical protein [Pseudomonas cremoricolorata]